MTNPPPSPSIFAAIRSKLGIRKLLSRQRLANPNSRTLIDSRKQRLLAVISTVGATAQKYSRQVEISESQSNLDLIEADLFTVLARDRGEVYAYHVLAGKIQAQPSGYAPLGDR